MVTVSYSHAVDPVPDITANGSDVSIAVSETDTLSVKVTLAPNDKSGINADWWVARESSGVWSYYDFMGGSMTWLKGLSVTYQGPLFYLSPTEVVNTNDLSTGVHKYYFGVDTVMNAIPDNKSLIHDSVDIYVYPSSNNVQDSAPYVDIYDPARACNGTTLFSNTMDSANPEIVEVDMLGRIIWQYTTPSGVTGSTLVGMDTEILSDNNILFNISGNGIYEIDRNGNIVWSHSDGQNSHDADRLANGNTLYVFGNNDEVSDAQIKEVDTQGNTVWSWYAKNDYDNSTYQSISRGGWTHANAVTRLTNGNTLISLRNFDLSVEVDTQGSTVWSFDWRTLGGTITDPHEPEMQSNNNLLVCMQRESPYRAIEIEKSTGNVVWSYANSDMRTARDCDRLSNGNTLIVAVLENGTKSDMSDDESVILEITAAGDIVWRLRLKNSPIGQSPGVFYKAERVCK